VEVLHAALDEAKGSPSYWQMSGRAQSIRDLTGDGIPEIFLLYLYGQSYVFNILKCESEAYEIVYEESWQTGDVSKFEIHSIQDVNGNGIDELLIDVSGGHGVCKREDARSG
jgi:hypothetical protein